MIKTSWLRGSVKIAALTVAFTVSGTGIALASTTSGNHSILGGNQISLPVSIPLNVCGNAIAVLGEAFGICQGGASAGEAGGGSGSGGGSGGGSGPATSGNGSIGGGNQVIAPISVPVNVCGNSVALLGRAASACWGGASTGGSGEGSGEGSHPATSGNGSIGGGNQVIAPISVPVDVCGNSVAVLGGAAAACQGVSSPPPPPPCGCHHHHHHRPPPCCCHHRHHHHHQPPPSHHRSHHGGTSASTGSTSLPTASSLPTTGADLSGLLALAAGVTVSGAGCVLLGRRHGLFIQTRRTDGMPAN